ncbi:MAG TPA: hypothetical protein VHQ90_17150 [Thermoanaerobaculia bacterium]|nr:hypothetical protein [Thermoanaerobaculia bacterium]
MLTPSELSNEKAKLLLYEGVLQRHLMMSTSRQRIFDETHKRGNLLDPDTATELDIHLNAYYLNLRGSLDNLAWILTFELELKPGLREEGKDKRFPDLFGRDFQAALEQKRPELLRWLKRLRKWRERIKAFRDPAAHRIPLLVTAGLHTDEKLEQREALEHAASEAIRRKDTHAYSSLQHEIRSLAEYRPVFSRSREDGFELYWLAGSLLRDQNVFLRIVRKVLGQLLGEISLRRYQECLARRRRRRLL